MVLSCMLTQNCLIIEVDIDLLGHGEASGNKLKMVSIYELSCSCVVTDMHFYVEDSTVAGVIQLINMYVLTEMVFYLIPFFIYFDLGSSINNPSNPTCCYGTGIRFSSLIFFFMI